MVLDRLRLASLMFVGALLVAPRSASAGDSDGDGVDDAEDRCPEVGGVFPGGQVTGAPGSAEVGDAQGRGLQGCPYLEITGCTVWGSGSSACVEVDSAIRANTSAFEELERVNLRLAGTARYRLVVDGLEDDVGIARRVADHPESTGPSGDFVADGEMAVRTLRAWSRARAAVEQLTGQHPGLVAEIGLVHLRRDVEERGVRIFVRKEPVLPGVVVQLWQEMSPPPPAPPPPPPPPGRVSVGLPGGYVRAHEQHWASLGVEIQVDPQWRARIAFDGSLGVLMGEVPIYLSRWEGETRLTRATLAARWNVLRNGVVTPFLTLGAFSEPSVIGIGPWGGVGLTRPGDGYAIDLTVTMPVFIPDKLGSVGVDALLHFRIMRPLHTSIGA